MKGLILVSLFYLMGCSGNSSKVSVPLDGYSKQPSIQIIGVKNSLEDKSQWQDFKIGFGLEQQLIEEIYQSNQFTLKEFPLSSPNDLNEFKQKLWTGEAISQSNFDADFQVYIEILDHYRNRSRMGVALANSQTIKTVLVLKIHLNETNSNRKWEVIGEGEAETKAGSLVFSFQEKSDVFAKNEASIASSQALKNAWSLLMFSPNR